MTTEKISRFPDWYKKPGNKARHKNMVKNWRQTPEGRLRFSLSMLKYYGKKLGISLEKIEAFLGEAGFNGNSKDTD